MSDINKISVLKAFIDHNKLSWPDFANKEIFLSINGGTERAHMLGNILKELENERHIIRLTSVVPPTWEILNTALIEHCKLTQDAERKLQKENIEFDNLKRDNWQKRNWLWLTIGGFVLGSVISPILLDLWKDRYSKSHKPDNIEKRISDTSSKKKAF